MTTRPFWTREAHFWEGDRVRYKGEIWEAKMDVSRLEPGGAGNGAFWRKVTVIKFPKPATAAAQQRRAPSGYMTKIMRAD